jgi:two-component system, OmpR family, response regulator
LKYNNSPISYGTSNHNIAACSVELTPVNVLEPGGSRLESQPKKVLVVENDEVIIVLISHVLTRQSYVVHSTFDALEAERMLERDHYDAILLDLKMPNGGIELIRKIEQRRPSLLSKVIVVTGAIHETAQLSDIPLNAVVRKPFEIENFIATVNACVNRPS